MDFRTVVAMFNSVLQEQAILALSKCNCGIQQDFAQMGVPVWYVRYKQQMQLGMQLSNTKIVPANVEQARPSFDEL